MRNEGADGGFLRGNLHVKKHSGKTVPAGNWTLIGSEVERDQLALAESRGTRGCIRQKWRKKGKVWRGGLQCACMKKKNTKNSGLVLIRCSEAL